MNKEDLLTRTIVRELLSKGKDKKKIVQHILTIPKIATHIKTGDVVIIKKID